MNEWNVWDTTVCEVTGRNLCVNLSKVDDWQTTKDSFVQKLLFALKNIYHLQMTKVNCKKKYFTI